MRRADGHVHAPLSRCPGCGGWVWLIHKYGCHTCQVYWALHGTTSPPPEGTGSPAWGSTPEDRD